MCGIAGLWAPRLDRDVRAIASGMAAQIRHRGPDDDGCWADDERGLALSHRRLSIVDLSPSGHQPMLSASRRFAIVFNGEIYNHGELRRELLSGPRGACSFRGQSDTEVLLAAIDAWGLRTALDRFVGMFAFALWDGRERELYLVRDRLGVKPLYYGWAGDDFVFGSELKAIAAHPAFDGGVDRQSVAALMRFAYIPAPHTIYSGIYKLPPGTIMRLRSPARSDSALLPYWSAFDVAARGIADPFTGAAEDAVAELERLLMDAIALRMVADVPLGAFLSGGVDSSTVAALMQAQSSRPVKTFTIGSFDADCDEAPSARAVAQHLGTDHTELYVTPQAALDVIPELPRIYDEPFADSSQLPTLLVSRLAREHVTVALSGDGGDEAFAGYNRHVWGERIWAFIRTLPLSSRSVGARAMTAVSPRAWTMAFRAAGHVLPARWQHRAPADKLQKLAGVLAAPTPEHLYRTLTSRWQDPTAVVLGIADTSAADAAGAQPRFDDLTTEMLYLDQITYLPDDILTKVDRASMACSLEAREPLLDHRVVEFAWRLPLPMKIRDGAGKWPLRQVLYRHVPKPLVDRTKSGFGVPIGAWLRGPLRPWAEDLLQKRRLDSEGFFDSAVVRRKWSEHLSGKANGHDELWAVLMFQAWHAEQKNRCAAAQGDGHRKSREATTACSIG